MLENLRALRSSPMRPGIAFVAAHCIWSRGARHSTTEGRPSAVENAGFPAGGYPLHPLLQQPARAMAKVGSAVLALVAALATIAAGQTPGSVLVRYSFDDGSMETGPDSVSVFEHARGTVRLSRAWRWSGETSVEIRDVAGDGDFPELQGYFPAVSGGTIYAHFALLTVTPEETFHVALAGPRGFRLARDGIAFWLQAREGHLWQVSDGIPRRIVALEPFLWYFVDLTYRVKEGTYDLAVAREADPARVLRLERQIGASGATGSVLDKFSFVGDIEEDASNAVFYIDDVLIGTDRSISLLPFVAPGRRRFFVQTFTEAASAIGGRPTCPPASEPRDFGLSPVDLAALRSEGLFPLFQRIVSGAREGLTRIASAGPTAGAILERAARWSEGCAALRAGHADAALSEFEAARSFSPVPLYAVSEAIALAALGRADEADERLAAASGWSADPRLALAFAMVGGLRGNFARAVEVLREPAARVSADDPNAACRAREDGMIAEQYFYALLANGFPDRAAGYADRMIAALEARGQPVAAWREKRGDAAFLSGDWHAARSFYEDAERENGSVAVLLKLADVDFQMGDLAAERARREKIYGALR